MKKLLKFSWRFVKVLFAVVLIFCCSLFFREQVVPTSLREMLCGRLSSTNHVFQCDFLSFGYGNGIVARGIRVYDSSRVDCLKPALSLTKLTIHPLQRRVFASGLSFLRLGDSYYAPRVPKEKLSRVEVTFPKLPEFRLDLEKPNILGLTPKFVSANVRSEPKKLLFEGIHIDWPEKAHEMKLDGNFSFDVSKQRAIGNVGGYSLPELIRPLLVALDVPSGLPYMDAFTEITNPVPARGHFDVDLTNNDFRMRLDLKPTMGRYNDVAMTKAEGVLDLYVYTRGTNCNVTLNLDLAKALDPEGKNLSGRLTMKMTNDLVRLAYDVKSELSFEDALKVADFIDPAALDVVKCETKPVITIKGVSGISAEDAAYNDIRFTARLKKGEVLGFPLNDIETDFSIRNDRVQFSGISAKGKDGGSYKGSVVLHIPGYDEKLMSYKMFVSCKDGTLAEITSIAGMDVGDCTGKVEGWCELSGLARTNSLDNINGRGCLKIKEGRLAQIKLFAGLTKLLADKVPGISFLVNQTEASADYTIENGVLKSENIFLEGGFFSVKAWGNCNLPQDNLDFTVRVQFLKKDSIIGKIMHTITWPFTKLLLEFKLKGSLEKPQWEYISIIDRVL